MRERVNDQISPKANQRAEDGDDGMEDGRRGSRIMIG